MAQAHQDSPGRHPLAERVARFLYGITGGTLVVRQEVPAEPHWVWITAGRVLPHPPFSLQLHDTLGGHPAEGGAAVFHLPPLLASYESRDQLMERILFEGRLNRVLIKILELRISPVAGGAALEVGADLDREVTLGLWFLPFVLLGGALLGVGGAVFLVPRLLSFAPVLDGISLPILASGAGLAVLVVVLLWYRWYCRFAVRKAEDRLQWMLARLREEALSSLQPEVAEGSKAGYRPETDPDPPRA